MTVAWAWPTRDRQNFWQRVRTLAQKHAEPVVHVLEVPGAFIPGASKALEKIDALFGSDLNISELDSGEVMEPLDGAPGPYASDDGASPVFIDGMRASVTASHNGTGDETISLERIDLHLIERKPGLIPGLEAQRDATQVFGAGFIEPLRFFVEVGARGPSRARRAIKGGDGKTEMLTADSANFLDTDPAALLALAPRDLPTVFRFTITARDPGMYTLCLRWFYRVAARELRQHTSLPFVIYRGE